MLEQFKKINQELDHISDEELLDLFDKAVLSDDQVKGYKTVEKMITVNHSINGHLTVQCLQDNFHGELKRINLSFVSTQCFSSLLPLRAIVELENEIVLVAGSEYKPDECHSFNLRRGQPRKIVRKWNRFVHSEELVKVFQETLSSLPSSAFISLAVMENFSVYGHLKIADVSYLGPTVLVSADGSRREKHEELTIHACF